MRLFSREDIDQARTIFREQGYEEASAIVGQHSFHYFVLPQEQEPNLLHFVLRLTGNAEEGYVLGIADSVKPQHRPYAIAHEYIEFTQIDKDAPNRCSRALEEELLLIPADIKSEYVRMHRDFFKNLAAYCAKQPEYYTPSDIAQFNANARRLEEPLE